MPVLVPIPITLFIGQRIAVWLRLVFTIYWARISKFSVDSHQNNELGQVFMKYLRSFPVAIAIVFSSNKCD